MITLNCSLYNTPELRDSFFHSLSVNGKIYPAVTMTFGYYQESQGRYSRSSIRLTFLGIDRIKAITNFVKASIPSISVLGQAILVKVPKERGTYQEMNDCIESGENYNIGENKTTSILVDEFTPIGIYTPKKLADILALSDEGDENSIVLSPMFSFLGAVNSHREFTNYKGYSFGKSSSTNGNARFSILSTNENNTPLFLEVYGDSRIEPFQRVVTRGTTLIQGSVIVYNLKQSNGFVTQVLAIRVNTFQGISVDSLNSSDGVLGQRIDSEEFTSEENLSSSDPVGSEGMFSLPF